MLAGAMAPSAASVDLTEEEGCVPTVPASVDLTEEEGCPAPCSVDPAEEKARSVGVAVAPHGTIDVGDGAPESSHATHSAS